MDGKYESKDGRNKFSASFGAAPGGTAAVGHVLNVKVGDEVVGSMTLATQLNGDIGGDLDFDTNVETSVPTDDTVPFPVNFPAVAAGTVVKIGTIECVLN